MEATLDRTPRRSLIATERRESPRRTLVLAALSTIAALVLFLAFWVAFFGLMGDMSGFN